MDYNARARIWLRAHGMPAISILTQGEEVTFQGDANGVPCKIAEVRVPAGVTAPTFADLTAISAQDEAAEVAASAALLARAAALDAAPQRVALLAAAYELAKEQEKIKAVIRAIHPAAADQLPARTREQWVAAIRAKAVDLADD